MIDKMTADAILDGLELIANRPSMYFGVDDDPEIARTFLFGIRHGLQLSIKVDSGELVSKFLESIKAHGWKSNALSKNIDLQMEEKGLSQRDIVLEWITIEIGMYKLLFNRSE